MTADEYAAQVERLAKALEVERENRKDLEFRITVLQARIEGLVTLTKGIYR